MTLFMGVLIGVVISCLGAAAIAFTACWVVSVPRPKPTPEDLDRLAARDDFETLIDLLRTDEE